MVRFGKKLLILVLGIWILSIGICGSAKTDQNVFDGAEILTDEEITQLEKECDTLSQKIQADVLIATSMENASEPKKEAKEFILDNERGYGDGKESILFLINMKERVFTVYEYNVEASGYLLTDDEIDKIISSVKTDMSAGDYLEACETYLDKVDYYSQITYGENRPEQDYDYSANSGTNESADGDTVGGRLLTAMVVSAVVIVIMVVKRNKDAKPEGAAYLKKGSQKINSREDFFTHTTVVKRRIETNSSRGGSGGGSSGSSSGGTSGGGHGGSSSF